jgi:hypothetical protein
MKKLLFPLVLALLAPGRAAFAQTVRLEAPASAGASSRWVTGIVRDGRTADPLPQVAVVVQGDTTHTTTDAAGRFKLLVPQAALAVLEFEAPGYLLQEQPLVLQTKPAMKVWLSRPVNWKSKKARARAMAQRQQQEALQKQAALAK